MNAELQTQIAFHLAGRQPAAGAEGRWQVEQQVDNGSVTGIDARHLAADGSLLGFALLGSAVRLRQQLAGRVPGLL